MSTPSLPTVSVIIPSYKQSAYIAASLDSVQAQTYEGEIEVIVVVDGSPEDDARVAREHPLDVRVIEQENTGVSGARNMGIARSTGEYLAFLDADDTWTPQKLELQLHALLRKGAPALSFTRYRRVHDDGSSPLANDHPSLALKVSPRRLLRQNFIGTSTVVVHRTCLERCGSFPSTNTLLKAGQDYALWLRVASLFPLIYVPEILMHYRVHEVNRVGTDPVKHFEGGLAALRDFERWSPERFGPLSGSSRRNIAGVRGIKLLKDVVLRRDEYDDGTWRRALSAVKEQLLT